jgi:hypothetical protein
MGLGTVRTAIRAGTALLILAAIVAQASVLVDAGAFDPSRFFAFFTIQSNLIAAVVLAALAIRSDRPRGPLLEAARGAATLYLTITFWVVILLLSNVDVQLGLVWVDVVLHKVAPVMPEMAGTPTRSSIPPGSAGTAAWRCTSWPS